MAAAPYSGPPWRSPRLDEAEATRQILAEQPQVKVVAVTTFHSEEYVIPALKSGASGYLLKDSSTAEIIAGIRAAVAGEFAASPQVTETLVRSVVCDPRAGQEPPEVATPDSLGLSDREIDVIRLLCKGCSNREIVHELYLAEPTVKSHIGRIMGKLEVRDRVQVVITAYGSRLIRGSSDTTRARRSKSSDLPCGCRAIRTICTSPPTMIATGG